MWHTGFVPSSVPPYYMLTIEVCGHLISMELDTGASVSVMAGKLYKRTFPGVAVEASGIMLRTYSGVLSQGQAQAGQTLASRKVEAVLKAPKPQNKKELQSYLGLINFYRRFLLNLSAHLQPLHILLRDEQRYSQLDKEGLTLMFGIKCFPQYLWGRKFEAVMETDKAVPVQASPRVVRWALKLAAYSYQLVYRPGKDLGDLLMP
ncbi:hypothetical protein MTO96_001213 [Rhipicephalus appendiculatus]